MTAENYFLVVLSFHYSPMLIIGLASAVNRVIASSGGLGLRDEWEGFL